MTAKILVFNKSISFDSSDIANNQVGRNFIRYGKIWMKHLNSIQLLSSPLEHSIKVENVVASIDLTSNYFSSIYNSFTLTPSKLSFLILQSQLPSCVIYPNP